ncbi:MAG: segregation/condensation protein A [Fibrobacterales bacterium]
MAAYEVYIDTFEGPMDLLLYLVQKSELSPKDISISEITDQFLDYIKDISETNLSTAGDFLYMASRLMLLKVRELLPREQQDDLEPIEFDADKEALIQQILEYEKFKAVSDDLRVKEEESYGCFSRGRSESFKKEKKEDDLSEENINLYHLYKGFLDCMKIQASESFHTIEIDDVLIEDRQQFIDNFLTRQGKALFEDLLGHDQRLINCVVSFIAILEMVKTDDIIVRQVETAGAMWVYRKKNNTEYVDEMMNDISIYTPDSEFKEGLADLLRARTKEAPKEYGIDTVLREITTRVSGGEVIEDDELMRLLGEEPGVVENVESTDVLEEQVDAIDDDNTDSESIDSDVLNDGSVVEDIDEAETTDNEAGLEKATFKEEVGEMTENYSSEFEDDDDIIDEGEVEVHSEPHDDLDDDDLDDDDEGGELD